MRRNPLPGRRAARLREENARLRAEAEELRDEQRSWREEAEQPHPVVSELLQLADRLSDLLADPARPADPAEAETTLRWLDGRLIRLLAACEVADLQDEGAVDPGRHEVVGGRPADDGRPVGSIAETVRRGYVWRGRVLRPQQVIVYTDDEP
ncbi:nucleotide exchange factor GrpE [Streptomyces pactum]|uniref:Nucleotide exchange factor GrpE n=1 Tax=Streptomyces pactum TaxID=68249 RepID=A0ABS0NEH3_9ACTN|nr:nucleotide exchange factor GrpE [Streptomyces pactum]MBH5333566.1 nucleotide exchange factor GrpE [Streptomyces pactum]